ncbi:prefoldin subunit 1 [Contarinia nasturtii]|uniref:prefoldin subunit 1 n=1 Tax=Contarinia nasturtii TaxID=265458 RepID=UPI0012D44BC5|nr:prefoldin subunit 1 [Contarinia nasturtii]
MSSINVMDLELKRAFTEMQVNKIETTKKLKMFELQTEMLKTSKKKYEITDKEVSNLTPDTRVYSSVGRMFVLSSLPEIHDEIISKQGKCDEILKSLDDKREFLLKTSKEQEESLRELVQQRKEARSN